MDVQTDTNGVRSTDNNTVVAVSPEMSPLTRDFPNDIVYMLPLRSSMMHYKKNMGRIVTSNTSPESDGDGLSYGRMYTMAAFSPIIGRAVVTNGYLCTCESVYRDVSDSMMSEVVSNLAVNSIKWLVRADPSNTYPIPFKRGTLLMRASEIHAVVESTSHSPYSFFWQNLYPAQKSVRTGRTMQIAADILSVPRGLTTMIPGTWVVRCEKVCSTVTERAVVMMLDR